MIGREGFLRLFDIEPGEHRLVLLLFAQYFCSGTASVFTQTTAFSLFLQEFGSQALPLAYIAMAGTVSLLTFVYLGIGQRLTFAGSLKLNLGSLFGILLLFAIGLATTDAPWLLFALPVLFQIVVVFGNMAFWSLAGRALNVRQGKRLFGLVGAGEWSAIVVMGFLVPLIVPVVGVHNLVWLAAIGMIGGVLVLLTTLRLYPLEVAVVVDDRSPSRTEAGSLAPVRTLLRNRYVLLIFALTLLWWIAFFFVDNLFYDRAQHRFPEANELAAFLGVYLGGLGILTLSSNFLFAGRVLGYLGLRSTLLILPFGLLVGALVMVTAGGLGAPLAILFWAAILTKVWGLGVGFSIDQSARSVLFQPLPAALRTKIQTLADGVVQPVATGLAGVLLLAIGSYPAPGPLPLIVGFLIVAVSLLAIAIRTGSDYSRMLAAALTKRRLGGARKADDMNDLAILQAGLESSHPGVVAYSMRALGEVQAAALDGRLPALLGHPAPEIRRLAFERIAVRNLTPLLPAVIEGMREESVPDVRGSALRAMAQLDGTGTQAELIVCLDDPEPAVRRGALVGLLRSGGAEGVRAATDSLRRRIGSPGALERAEAAGILGECDVRTDPHPLLALLRDPDARVRRAALAATTKLKDDRFWPVVIDGLRSAETRSAAATALVAGGKTCLPEIGRMLAGSDLGHDDRIRLVKVCGLIGGQTAVELLEAQMHAKESDVRKIALAALRRCGYRAGRKGAMELRSLLKAEIAHATWLCECAGDIGPGPETMLLRSALAEELGNVRDRILDLLSFSGDAIGMARARDDLLSGRADRVAYALEMIDTQTPASLKGGILPLFQIGGAKRNPAGSHGPASVQGRRLQELSRNADDRVQPWTQACALCAAVALELPESEALLEHCRTAPASLVREAALWLAGRGTAKGGKGPMLSTIEKVLILRTASIFAKTADEILADVAQVSWVVDVPAGETILDKGGQGDTLYVIASGSVDVHDVDAHLSRLVSGDVFGEMAVLDPQPRSASVTAVEQTRLLCLDQQTLYELIDIRPEVARGLLKVLSQRLRSCLSALSETRERPTGLALE